MNCLCCGKPLKTNEVSGWHKSCIRRFFGTSSIPEIGLDNQTLERIVTENVSRGLTVPGVQKKLSLHLFSGGGQPRLTLVDYPTGYILKPQVEEFRAMPEAEHLVMSMADFCGIATVPHALVVNSGAYAYITKRVDRSFDRDRVTRFAMEDFCQLDLRLTSDKYLGSYERCAKLISNYSSRAMLDLSEFFTRLVFCFLTGNSDMHLKNFSLIETAERSNEYVLSPAYDLLPVNVLMPEDQEEFALTFRGKKRNLRRKDFLSFAGSCGIPMNAAEKMIDRLKGKVPELLEMCEESLLPGEMKESLGKLIGERNERI